MKVYLDIGHAELVPVADLRQDVFFLLLHVVRKESSIYIPPQ